MKLWPHCSLFCCRYIGDALFFLPVTEVRTSLTASRWLRYYICTIHSCYMNFFKQICEHYACFHITLFTIPGDKFLL
jgi:hypothetical protein